MAKLPQASEHQIQTSIMQYLRTKGWYCERLNAGKYSVGEGRNRRFINGVAAGTPDLMAFKEYPGLSISDKGVELLFIEVKVPSNKPTPLQEAKMEELEAHGATCYVIHSLEELQKLGI